MLRQAALQMLIELLPDEPRQTPRSLATGY